MLPLNPGLFVVGAISFSTLGCFAGIILFLIIFCLFKMNEVKRLPIPPFKRSIKIKAKNWLERTDHVIYAGQ